ncbi:MAG: tyrosine--tRNA ligase [Alphaproteobacteria bacterium]
MGFQSEFLQVLDERGLINQCTDLENLDKLLASEMVSAYVGYDPTAASLHVGHMISIIMLRRFQQAGHRPVVLMGGGTGMVGDPTGKDAQRNMLTEEVLQKNIEAIKGTFSHFIEFGDKNNNAIMVNNADWLAKFSYLEFLRDFGPHFTINRMLTFDSVKSRLDREQPLTFLEFNYMLLQGVDFLQLSRDYNVRLQMGGSDQWGNILNGVELGRRVDATSLFGLTCPLLLNSAGKKMGKTESGAVWLDANLMTPYDFWQYWRNVDDADVGKLLRMITDLPMDEIKKLEALEGSEVNEAKKILADEITTLVHGAEAAKNAKETAQKTFEQGSIGDDLPRFEVPTAQLEQGIKAFETLVLTGLCSSNGDARRQIKGGGGRLNGKAFVDATQNVTLADINDEDVIMISLGKKKHALIIPC